MTSVGNRSLLDRAQARYLDTNGNGRFEVSEFINFEIEKLKDVKLAAIAEPFSVSELSILSLEMLTVAKMRHNYNDLRNQIGDLFPCGVEVPSDAELNTIVSVAHRAAKDIRASRANSSFGDMLSASWQSMSRDAAYTADIYGAMAELSFGDTRPPACTAPQRSAHRR